ncbi:MAG TPA: L-aspartate oxidase [Feifaniaceae bacterium]|nr:L-aspartate oxidase [Feifaniaceae bacterium]
MKILPIDAPAAGELEADALIAGAGAAGLYAALNFPKSFRCVVLDKSGAEVSNSMYAQGGISAVTQADFNLREGHAADTLTAGAGLCDEAAVRVLVNEAAENIERLIALGVPFDRKGGELLRTREGGHRERRILHCGGDATGLHLTKTLLEQAKRRENIRFIHRALLTDILAGEYGVTGAAVLTKNGETLVIKTRRVILASGGIGRIYADTTNAACATGDGMAAARRLGVTLKDMEFVQFHPTVLCGPDEEGRSFLVSEALRGEGARLKNGAGDYFMQGVHPMADLAPRDVVARAIFRELQNSGETFVYLDITHRSRAFLEERFPTIFAECLRRGMDISKDCIPVHPIQHYMMGGVAAGLSAETSLPGLYACGETACTGIHGANRLASNSLLECVVFGRRAALHAAALSLPAAAPKYAPGSGTPEREIAPDVKERIRAVMSARCGIIRDEAGLSAAEGELTEIEHTLGNARLHTKDAVEALNMAQTALAIAKAARARKKSIGAHYRSDGEEE